jgi:competence protein ComEA
MNRLRAWLRSFFGFSRTETNGFLILLPLCFIIIFIEPIYQFWFTSQPQDSSKDVALLDSIVSNWKFPSPTDSTTVKPGAKRFPFDPNSASREALIELGFEEKIVNRIVNFRSKGGKFKIKSDLKKIYGIDTLLTIELYPFNKLPEAIKQVDKQRSTPASKPTSVTPEIVDINVADTSALIRLKGIGAKLALRIVKYRDRLGGFVSSNQFHEIYGLDSLAISELKTKTIIINDFIPRQININTATEKQLTSLPYITFTLAKAIVAYRFQHKNFNAIDDLKNIAILDEARFQKIKPYLTVKD